MSLVHLVHSTEEQNGGVASAVLSLNKNLLENGVDSSIQVKSDLHNLDSKKNFGIVAHGLWQWPGVEALRIHKKSNLPYVVFPHGMLDPWFKNTYPFKHLKKQLYWWWRQEEILRRARAVCFTTKEEMRLAQKTFWPSRFNSLVTGLGVEDPPAEDISIQQNLMDEFPQLKNKRVLLYLGRFHEKKGVDLLLDAWKKCQKEDQVLVLAGPEVKDRHFKLLKEKSQNEKKDIVWTGMLKGERKWAILRIADALILPSHQENFGMVVAEAMAVGKPVYLTNKVNLWREVMEAGAGLVESDDQDGVDCLIEKWRANQHKNMGKNAENCFRDKLHIRKAAEKIISLFLES